MNNELEKFISEMDKKDDINTTIDRLKRTLQEKREETISHYMDSANLVGGAGGVYSKGSFPPVVVGKGDGISLASAAHPTCQCGCGSPVQLLVDNGITPKL